jgi:hypothetical protein
MEGGREGRSQEGEGERRREGGTDIDRVVPEGGVHRSIMNKDRAVIFPFEFFHPTVQTLGALIEELLGERSRKRETEREVTCPGSRFTE